MNTRITKILVSIFYVKHVFSYTYNMYSITESQIDIQILNHFWDPLEMKRSTLMVGFTLDNQPQLYEQHLCQI